MPWTWDYSRTIYCFDESYVCTERRNRLIKFLAERLIYNQEDFNAIIDAYNVLVDALEAAYDEINRLSEDMEKLKAGKQE